MSDDKKHITDDDIKAFLGRKLMECEQMLAKEINEMPCLFDLLEPEKD